jgi:hypothetical protein
MKNKKGEQKQRNKTPQLIYEVFFQKTNLVCNPDFRVLVALGAPRSGFLA